MGFNRTSYLQILIKALFFLLLCTPVSAAVTFESISANGNQIYSGDIIPANLSLSITIESNIPLSTAADAMVIKIDSTGTNLALSALLGTITSSHSTTLSDGMHNIRLTVKDTNGKVVTWEATNLSVDSGGSLRVLGTPLNYPNPCNASDSSTSISYYLSKPANITLSIHDMMGNLIKRSSCSSNSNGGRASYNEVQWDLKTEGGASVGNGIYIYLILGDGKLLAKGKIAIIK